MVRLATSFDASAIATLFHETVKKVNSRDYDVKQIAAWAGAAPDVAKWRARQAGRTTWVFEVGGTVRGFAEFGANGQVEAIYVHADHQRKGIASALLSQIEEEARRLGGARLYTETSTTARGFFQKRGFKVLKPAEVDARGLGFTNFRMAKPLL
jgi:putative acetyltransferase